MFSERRAFMEEYVPDGNTPELNGAIPIANAPNAENADAAETSYDAADDAGTESVDDILAEIMGDGSFNDDFTGLYARYLGGRMRGDMPAEDGVRQRVEYEAPPEKDKFSSAKKKSFEEKLPAGMRVVYDAAEEDARRPEFTSDGEVRYPTMGSGEAEERVVYDASWEAQAKQDAAKREARRRETALMGDGAYARSFVSGGMPIAKRGGAAEKRPSVNPRFIDPLSDDDTAEPVRPSVPDVPKTDERRENKVNNSEKSEQKNPFFQDGFSARSGNPAAADGKTYGTPPRAGASSAAADPAKESSSVPTEPIIDDAILDAFARSQKSDEDFRERWKNEIELAEKRKKERAEAESRRKAELRAEKERQEAEKKALADDRPGIPLEIDGAEEAAKAAENAPTTDTAQASGAETVSEYSGFSFSEENMRDIPDSEIVEKISTRDIPARAVMSTVDRTVKKSAGERFAFFFKTRFSAESIHRKVKEILPQKGDGGREVARKIVRIISFLALAAAVIYLIVYFVRYETRKRNDAAIDREMEQTLPADEVDNAWADIKAKYPDVEFPEGMNIKFANTYAINSDVVGYLRIAGEKTNIGTILLQSKSDDNYYLYRDMYGKRSRYGNPFVKSTSSMAKSGLSQNTIIYGHNTHDGLMFHELENYMKVDGYLDAPIVTLDTLFEQTKWKIFAVILTNSTLEADNNYIFRYLYSTFDSKQHYTSVLNGILERSMIHTGVDVTAEDRILTLYTCYQTIFDGGRLVVFARQLRDGETEEINKSKVYYNGSARFPQAYYDARNMTNPFAQATEPTETETEPTSAVTTSVTEVSTENTTESATDVTHVNVTEQATAAEPSVTASPPETQSQSSVETAPVTEAPPTSEAA